MGGPAVFPDLTRLVAVHWELSARSAAHALSVLGAMFRWLIEQRYVLANAFAGVKVRGTRPCAMDTGRAFSDGEWSLLRTVADGLKWSYHWEEAAAQRLRFVLNFAYATGLRAEELVSAKLGQTEVDDHGDQWLKVVGKGAKAGKVRCRPWRGRRSTATWPAGDAGEVEAGHTRRRQPQRRGCDHGNTLVEHLQVVLRHCRHRRRRAQPATADKLRRATPHWMRHTHATHALDGGAELKSVRDNLRHASIATTSVSARRQCAAGEAGGRGVRRASEVVRSPAGLATLDLASRCTTRCAGHCRDAWMTEFSGHWSAQKRTNLHKQYDPTF